MRRPQLVRCLATWGLLGIGSFFLTGCGGSDAVTVKGTAGTSAPNAAYKKAATVTINGRQERETEQDIKETRKQRRQRVAEGTPAL